MSPQVAAVVPVYRPDSAHLDRIVSGLIAANVPVLVADDASPSTSDSTIRRVADQGASTVRHLHNAGIARSLNDGLSFASAAGARWLLTVDQDSELPSGYLTGLLDAADSAERILGVGLVGAVGAGAINDSSGVLAYPTVVRSGIATTHEVIQSGTLWLVDALLAVGGFDESLGIDAVDAAASLALREAGLSVVLAPAVSITHRVGEGRQIRLLGRSVLASGHSPERRATMVRNRLRLFPAEFAQSPTHALRTIRRVVVNTALAVTIEDDRWAKAKASARGLLPKRNG